MVERGGNSRTEEAIGRPFTLRKKFIRAGAPTETGRRAQRLVLADHALKNHFNPTVASAMAGWLIEQEQGIRQEGLEAFGVPEDKADATIAKMAAKLEREGIPFYRVGAFNEELQARNQHVGGGPTRIGIPPAENRRGGSLGDRADGGQVGPLPTHGDSEALNQ